MWRIGIDLGGTKTEAVLMAEQSRIVARQRLPTPHHYHGQIATIVALVNQMQAHAGGHKASVGIGHPGAIAADGCIKNANSICLNGQPLKADIEAQLGYVVRMANDADCLAVSEATDGAGANATSVFAVILGTGVGGGIVVNGQLLQGKNRIAGEWGHNPLPWPRADWDEIPGPAHWDGQHGAIETYLSGTGLAADHLRCTGIALNSEAIAERAGLNDAACLHTMARYEHRLARALASIINVLDPEVIVLGGGLSQLPQLYINVPKLWTNWVFSPTVLTRLVAAQHGDSSGVRGAACL